MEDEGGNRCCIVESSLHFHVSHSDTVLAIEQSTVWEYGQLGAILTALCHCINILTQGSNVLIIIRHCHGTIPPCIVVRDKAQRGHPPSAVLTVTPHTGVLVQAHGRVE